MRAKFSSRRDLLIKGALAAVGGALGSLPLAGAAQGADTGPLRERTLTGSDEVYATIGAALERFLARNDVRPGFGRQAVTLAVVLTDPRATIVVKLNSRANEVSFSRDAHEVVTADSTVTMKARTAHELLTGQRNLGEVTAARELAITGDRQALAVLATFPMALQPEYLAVLQQQRAVS